MFADDGWDCLPTQEFERAAWVASIRSFRVIVLSGHSQQWSRDAVATIRPLTPTTPVLVLVPDLEETQASMLRLGADMVLEESAGPELLRAGIHALLRRAQSTEPTLRYLATEHLRVDLWARSATLDGDRVELTPTEFDILRFLMTQSQIAVKHHEIIKAVWGWKYTDERNALRLHINRLRNKLVDPSGQPRYIRSVRGVGYVFAEPVAEFAGDRGEQPSAREQQPNLMLEGRLRDLVRAMVAAGSRHSACVGLVRTVVAEGICDGSAVFARRPDEDVLDLVAQAGMTPQWQAAVADGLPLTDRFLATETFITQQVRNYVDISKLTSRYGRSARLLRAADLPAQVSIPLVDKNGVWGQLGFGRRSDSPFTTAQSMLLEAAGVVLGALFADDAPSRD